MMLDLGSLLKESVDVVKKNYELTIPAVVSSLARVSLGSFVVVSEDNLGILFPIGIIVVVLDYFAHGVALAMAREAMEKGKTSLNTALRVASTFFFHFLITAILLALIIGLGFMLILPGLVAMFFLMFTFAAIIMHGLSPVEAIKRSYAVVRKNLNDSVILFLVLGGIVIAFSIVGLMFAVIPAVGQFVSVVLNGMVGGFSAVLLLKVYKIFEARQLPESQ